VRVFDFENDDIQLQTEHDFQDMDFVWYDNPIEHFDLLSIDHKVNSFYQLRYYCEVLFFLNSDMSRDLLKGIFRHIGSRDSGKSIRTYSKHRVEQMVDEVLLYKKTPYCHRMRRIIFNPNKIMSQEEKQSIASKIISKGFTYTEFDLRQIVDKLSDKQVVITNKRIASEMMCSERTVSRLMNNLIKNVIVKENEKTRRELSIAQCIEWIEVLSDNGNQMKMQELKNLSNVRDYSVIKEAINRYEIEF